MKRFSYTLLILLLVLSITSNITNHSIITSVIGKETKNDVLSIRPKEIIQYSFVETYFDPPEISPIDLYISEGILYQGDIFSLIDVSDKVVIGDENGLIDVYIKFKFGGEGVLRWYFILDNPNVSLSLRYFSANIGDFVSVGTVSEAGNITLPNISKGYEDELIVNFRCNYNGGSYNLTMYWIKFDITPYKDNIMFELVKSNLEIEAISTIHIAIPYTVVSFVNISRYWELTDSYPSIVWDYTIMGFVAKEEGDYYLVFKVNNYWDYDTFKIIPVELLDSSGEPIDPKDIEVYYTPINLTTNESIWHFNRSYIISNPLPIDLYNVSFTITLSESNFNFFRINGDPLELQVYYKGQILPHIIKEWGGHKLVLETTIPILKANSSNTIYLLYGGLKGIKFTNIDLGFYGTDFNYSNGLEDWIQIYGSWMIIKHQDGKWYLFTNASGTINLAWFKGRYPQQVKYILHVKAQEYPIKFDVLFRNNSQKNYFYQIYIDKSSSLVFAYVVLYENVSGTLRTVTQPYVGTFPKSIKEFVLEIGVSNQATYLKINNINMQSYTFQDTYNYPLQLGILVNGTTFYMDKFNIRNFYDGTPSYTLKEDKQINIVKIMGQRKRLMGIISGINLDAVQLDIYDALGRHSQTLYYIVRENIEVKTNLVKVTYLSSLEGKTADIYAKDNNSLWFMTLLPSERKTIYLDANYTTIIGWKYESTNSYVEVNLTLKNDVNLVISGDSISDILQLLKQVNNSIIHKINARIDSFETKTLFYLYGISGNLTSINDTLQKVKLSLSVINSTLGTLELNISLIIDKISIINSNLTQTIDYLIAINKTAYNNSDMNIKIFSILQNLSANITNVSELLNSISSELEKQKLVLDSINNTLSSQKIDLIYLRDKVNQLSLELSKINSTVNSLNSILSNVSKELSSLSERLNKSLTNLETYIESLNNSVKNLETLSQYFMKNLSNVQETINSIFNTTMKAYSLLLYFNKTVISKLNLLLTIVNETLTVRLVDEFTNLEIEITRAIYDLNNNISQMLELVKEAIIDNLQLREIRVVNEIDNTEVNSELLKIKLGEYLISSGSLILLASKPELKVVDYWEREISFNLTIDYKITLFVKVGYLYIVNNRLEVIKVLIRPVEILDKQYEIYVRGLDYEMLTLPIGDYLVSIYKIDGEKISENVISLKMSILDKSSYRKEIVISNKASGQKSGIIDTRFLWIALPVSAISFLGYIYLKSRSLRSMEFDEEEEIEL